MSARLHRILASICSSEILLTVTALAGLSEPERRA